MAWLGHAIHVFVAGIKANGRPSPAMTTGAPLYRPRLRTTNGRHHAPSRPVEGNTPVDDALAGTRRHAAAAVHPERESHVARPDLDHRVGGPGAWLSGLRYAVRDRRQQQVAAADVRGARRLGRRVDLDLYVARWARLPRWRKGPGEGLRDVAEALGLARFVRPAIDEGGE